jgi:nucleoside-diphosphate-sugar epimerase
MGCAASPSPLAFDELNHPLDANEEAFQSTKRKGTFVQPITLSSLWHAKPRLTKRRFTLRSEALLRMLADLFSVNVSLALAILFWYFLSRQFLYLGAPDALMRDLGVTLKKYAALWSSLALVIFYLYGFYTHARRYAHGHKAFVVARATTVLVAAFAVLDHFAHGGKLFPFGIAVLAWMLVLLTVGGSRLAKHLFFERYRVEPIAAPQRPNRVLVVGGAGYLGSALVPMLLERNYRVRVLDSLLFGRESLHQFEKHASFELAPGDVREIESVVQAMKGCDAVIDLAAIVGDPACEENPQLAAETNRAATRMLIDVARGYGVRRFLFASTCSVYGASDYLMDECAPVAPISLYAQTKVDSEKLLLEARCADFHPTILRLATLFGVSPRPRFDLVVNLLTVRALRSGKITIYNGEQWRPFLHVRDAARSFIACLEAPLTDVSGEIFNAGSFELNYRLSQVAEKIMAVIPEVEVENVENTDRRNYRVAFDKIHTRLGFVCECGLEEGIREIAEMVRASTVEDFTAEAFNNRAMVRRFAQTEDAGRSSIRLLESLAKAQ